MSGGGEVALRALIQVAFNYNAPAGHRIGAGARRPHRDAAQKIAGIHAVAAEIGSLGVRNTGDRDTRNGQ